MGHGCKDCKYCKCYPGGRWSPNEYECVSDVWDRIDVEEDILVRVWEDGEEWGYGEEQICPGWEEAPTEEDEYWARYAYEENRGRDTDG